ncbi:helix-turn-helix domain-containing protein [Rufibacter radiotolerans]|uniref:helix-turn-helix domain-containing protein n=1 Tax=Rufibacter radiotolerans TaxID=1379910 RepID=UPI0006645390|nr:helix-turn-helix domain-containing protein [Rufibacter radiotolerans]
MDNPFIKIDERLSGLEKIALELYNIYQAKAKNSAESDKPLNAMEAAEFLGIPKNTLYALTSRREITHCKRGKQLFFQKKDLLDWLEAGRQRTVAEIQLDTRKGVRRA